MKRSHATALAGAALAVALLVWLIARLEDPTAILRAFADAASRPVWLVAGLAAFGGCLLCGTVRWWVLLTALSLPIQPRRAVQLYAVGHFFNVVVPGATGGDVVKATCAALDSPGRRPEAVASILVERLFGLVALCVLVAVVALARPSFFASSVQLRVLRGFSLTLGVVSVAGTLLLFGINWTRWLPTPGGTHRWHRLVDTLVRLYNAGRLCAGHPRALWSALGLSLLNHLMAVGCAWCMGRALGLAIAGVDYLTVFPIVNAVAAVPLTPGGAGVRETATCVLLGVAGATEAQGTALSLLVYGAILAWALLGGICYLSLRSPMRRGAS
jgi:hypothetical protein